MFKIEFTFSKVAGLQAVTLIKGNSVFLRIHLWKAASEYL